MAKQKVLVVDNDRLILTFLEDLLKDRGYEVLTAEDGLSALDVLKDHVPDIIFVDLVMPNISGDKLCQIIRSMPQLENTFIVVLSAIAAEQRVNPAQLNADAQIAKSPLADMARNILAVLSNAESLIRPLAPPDSIVGLEKLHSREITRELLDFTEHFELILSSMAESIFEMTADQRIVYTNPSAIALTGRPEALLLGGYFHDLFVPRERDSIRSLLEGAQQAGTPVHNAGPFSMNRRKVSLSLISLGAASDKWVAILDDVTELKKIEAQLLSAQRMEAIGTLAAGIAHDFNNLLMNIQGNVSLMLWPLAEDHPHYERLRKIEQQVQNGSRLTAQLLGYARKGRYDVRELQLNQLVTEAADAFIRTRKQITFHSELAPDLHVVEGDQSQMEQVLLNLFVNASDAMPQGGHLHVRTRNAARQEIASPSLDPHQERYVRLCVTDTGCGMEPRTLERIFEPFFTTKAVGQGTGLGLASVYGIVKGHAGHIEVESEIGKGSTFTVFLPASERQQVAQDIQDIKETRRAAERLGQTGECVLLVDDEERIRDVGRELLEALGYRVLTAEDGGTALELFAERHPDIDLVLLDMVMPGMSGGEFYDRLKATDPHARVLLASGYSLDGEATQIMQRGCDGFIQKPFRLHELSSKIREILAKA